MNIDPDALGQHDDDSAGEDFYCDFEYDVVDPDSQVTPDGTPVDFSDLPDE